MFLHSVRRRRGQPRQACKYRPQLATGPTAIASGQSTLGTAFPKFTLVINISPSLVLAYNDTGFYQTIGQYADHLFSISKSIMNSPTYRGVQVAVQGSKIIVDDETQSSAAAPVQINFQDLIGQPIWTGVNQIQFKTVMRGDIPLLTKVKMPNALTSLTPAGAPASVQNPNTNASIQGVFTVTQQRHTGNFRQPDWASWCTTFEAVTPLPSSGSVGR